MHETFPQIPVSTWQRSQTPSFSQSQLASQLSLNRGDISSQDSQVTDKENAPPLTTRTPDRPPVPPFNSTTSPSTTQHTSTADKDAPYVLPPELAQLHQSIVDTLRRNFPLHPPYTIQRLAELILRPKKNYRFVGPYLRALDRVVNVSSNVNQYPLASGPSPYSSLPNGGGFSPPVALTADELGSDESLGGALLTPIPWLSATDSSSPSPMTRSRANTTGSLGEGMKLQNESSDMVIGPAGKPVKVETVSVVNGALTSPLMAGQQESAGATAMETDAAVAANQQLKDEEAASKGEMAGARDDEGDVAMTGHNAGSMEPDSKETLVGDGPNQASTAADDETPHARGPEAITAEDTGKVDGSAGSKLDFVKAAGKTDVAAATTTPAEAAKPLDTAAAESERPPSLKRSADTPPEGEASAAAPKLRARTRSQSMTAARDDGRKRSSRKDDAGGEGRASLASAPAALAGEQSGAAAEGDEGDAAAEAQQSDTLAVAALDGANGSAAGAAGADAGGQRALGLTAMEHGDGDGAQDRGTGRQGNTGNVVDEAMEGTEARTDAATTEENGGGQQRSQRDTEMTEG